MKIKKLIKNWLYGNYPQSQVVLEKLFERSPILRKVLRVGSTPTFNGWGMTTCTHTPWSFSVHQSTLDSGFLETHQKLVGLILENRFQLSQFSDGNAQQMVSDLMWRHYIVHWSASFASHNTKSKFKGLAECGVCDGLTSFYAMSGVERTNFDWGCYLYDAWEGMRDDLLLDSEKDNKGEYEYLNVETTKSNLASFGSRVRFNKGYIPESFQSAENPDSLVWLHIDLNSAEPTIAALDFFWPRLVSGSLILFDDYSWVGYEDTRNLVLSWLKDKQALLLPLPTGQAIIFKD